MENQNASIVVPTNDTLYRSKQDRLLGGVCGGIAERYGYDVTVVRLCTVLLFVLVGVPLLVYLIACLVIPLNPHQEEPTDAPSFKRSNVLWIIVIIMIVAIITIGAFLGQLSN